MDQVSLNERNIKARPQQKRRRNVFTPFLRNWELYVIISPVLAYYLIFEYFPMYGVQIAFKISSRPKASGEALGSASGISSGFSTAIIFGG